MNPWNINIRTERFQKYSPYTLSIAINIYMMKALPITNLIFYQFWFLQKQEVWVKILTKYFTTSCMKTIQKFLQQKLNLKPEKKIKSCTLSEKRYVYFLYKSNRGSWESWYLSLCKRKFLHCTFECKWFGYGWDDCTENRN